MHSPVSELGAGMQQIVEILRAFYKQPRVLILDEPTASLSLTEIEPFLAFVREIVNTMGVSVIFISHKLEEVFKIADRVTVFTDGKNVLTKKASELTEKECINAMLRKSELPPIALNPKPRNGNAKPLLISRSSVYDNTTHDIHFEIYGGEVVGFYGLVGSGRTECFQALYGTRTVDKIDAEFDGIAIHKPNPSEMIKRGMIMTPERRSDAKFTGMTLMQNICNLYWNKFCRNSASAIKYKKAAEFAERILKKCC